MPLQLLLGPQRPVTNLSDVVAQLPEGPVAVISAGWQEAEADIDDVAQLIPRELIDLNLYSRTEAVFAADTRLRDAHQQRQQSLKELQRLYRLRLRSLMLAARKVQREDAQAELKQAALEHTMGQIRALDQHHLAQSEMLHQHYAKDLSAAQSPALAEQIAGAGEQVQGCSTVLITGGNVAILLNRLRMFDASDWLHDRQVVAWSAGAMALSSQVVLFNDHTPHGRRDPEVLMAGLGVLPGEIFLPAARTRLKTGDTTRMRLMARRFLDHRCVSLDSGALVSFEGGELLDAQGVQRLTTDGGFVDLVH